MLALNKKMIDLIVLMIFLTYAMFSIIVGSYSAEDGFVNADSAEYLRLSERLLSGHWFFIPTSGRLGEAEEILFAVWPVGYSTLIATVAYITDLSSFAASKVLNVLLLSIAIISLYTQ